MVFIVVSLLCLVAILFLIFIAPTEDEIERSLGSRTEDEQ